MCERTLRYPLNSTNGPRRTYWSLHGPSICSDVTIEGDLDSLDAMPSIDTVAVAGPDGHTKLV